MATPIENNTTGLEEILRAVNELPTPVNTDDFVRKDELPSSVREIVQEELDSTNDFVRTENLTTSVTTIVQNELTNRNVPGKSRITVTLNASSWDNLSQSVMASGVTADNDLVISPASSSHDAYVEAGVRCTAQTSNRLTFICTEKPSSNLSVNVLILT